MSSEPPKINEKHGLEPAGVTTVRLGKVTAAEAIQKHSRSGLDVITSGSIPPNPAELIQ